MNLQEIKTLFILNVLFYELNHATGDRSLSTSMKFYVIGIYSSCLNEHPGNLTTQARIFNQSVELVQKVLPSLVDSSPLQLDIDYQSYDVCYNNTHLLSLLTDLLLDSNYMFTEQPDNFLNRQIINWKYQSRILAITAIIPRQMAYLMASVFQFTKVPVFIQTSLRKENQLPSYLTNVFRSDSQFNNLLDNLHKSNESFFARFKVNEIIFLQFLTFNEEMNEFYATMVNKVKKYVIKAGQICLKIATLRRIDENKRKIVEHINNTVNERRQIVVLFGRTLDQFWFLTLLNKAIDLQLGYSKNIAVFTTDFPIHRPYYQRNFKKIKFLTIHISNSIRGGATEWGSKIIELALKYGKSLSKGNRSTTIGRFLYQIRKGNITTVLVNNIDLFLRRMLEESDLRYMPSRRQFDVEKLLHQNLEFDQEVYRETITINTGTPFNKSIDLSSNCSSVLCPPGFYRVFGQINTTSKSIFPTEYAFKCALCPPNHIKPLPGKHPCQPCQGFYAADKNKTKCLDPFKAIHFGTNSGKVAMTISVVGVTLTLVTGATFYKFRKSPIVKMSERSISFGHLSSLIITFISLPLLYLTEPSTISCSMQSIIIAVFYNTNFTIILVKSNKLVRAFTSNVRASTTEVLMTSLIQYFTVIINLLIASAILTIAWYREPPNIVIYREFLRFEYYRFCNNSGVNIVLITFILLVNISCFVQAYRCRRLPGYVGEAMPIVYLSFTTTVSSSVMYPIFYFQKNQHDASMVHLFILLVNSLILVFFIYSRKVYRMLFHPEKNTKTFFRKTQMKAIEMKTRRKQSILADTDEH